MPAGPPEMGTGITLRVIMETMDMGARMERVITEAMATGQVVMEVGIIIPIRISERLTRRLGNTFLLAMAGAVDTVVDT